METLNDPSKDEAMNEESKERSGKHISNKNPDNSQNSRRAVSFPCLPQNYPRKNTKLSGNKTNKCNNTNNNDKNEPRVYPKRHSCSNMLIGNDNLNETQAKTKNGRTRSVAADCPKNIGDNRPATTGGISHTPNPSCNGNVRVTQEPSGSFMRQSKPTDIVAGSSKTENPPRVGSQTRGNGKQDECGRVSRIPLPNAVTNSMKKKMVPEGKSSTFQPEPKASTSHTEAKPCSSYMENQNFPEPIGMVQSNGCFVPALDLLEEECTSSSIDTQYSALYSHDDHDEADNQKEPTAASDLKCCMHTTVCPLSVFQDEQGEINCAAFIRAFFIEANKHGFFFDVEEIATNTDEIIGTENSVQDSTIPLPQEAAGNEDEPTSSSQDARGDYEESPGQSNFITSPLQMTSNTETQIPENIENENDSTNSCENSEYAQFGSCDEYHRPTNIIAAPAATNSVNNNRHCYERQMSDKAENDQAGGYENSQQSHGECSGISSSTAHLPKMTNNDINVNQDCCEVLLQRKIQNEDQSDSSLENSQSAQFESCDECPGPSHCSASLPKTATNYCEENVENINQGNINHENSKSSHFKKDRKSKKPRRKKYSGNSPKNCTRNCHSKRTCCAEFLERFFTEFLSHAYGCQHCRQRKDQLESHHYERRCVRTENSQENISDTSSSSNYLDNHYITESRDRKEKKAKEGQDKKRQGTRKSNISFFSSDYPESPLFPSGRNLTDQELLEMILNNQKRIFKTLLPPSSPESVDDNRTGQGVSESTIDCDNLQRSNNPKNVDKYRKGQRVSESTSNDQDSLLHTLPSTSNAENAGQGTGGQGLPEKTLNSYESILDTLLSSRNSENTDQERKPQEVQETTISFQQSVVDTSSVSNDFEHDLFNTDENEKNRQVQENTLHSETAPLDKFMASIKPKSTRFTENQNREGPQQSRGEYVAFVVNSCSDFQAADSNNFQNSNYHSWNRHDDLSNAAQREDVGNNYSLLQGMVERVDGGQSEMNNKAGTSNADGIPPTCNRIDCRRKVNASMDLEAELQNVFISSGKIRERTRESLAYIIPQNIEESLNNMNNQNGNGQFPRNFPQNVPNEDLRGDNFHARRARERMEDERLLQDCLNSIERLRLSRERLINEYLSTDLCEDCRAARSRNRNKTTNNSTGLGNHYENSRNSQVHFSDINESMNNNVNCTSPLPENLPNNVNCTSPSPENLPNNVNYTSPLPENLPNNAGTSTDNGQNSPYYYVTSPKETDENNSSIPTERHQFSHASCSLDDLCAQNRRIYSSSTSTVSDSTSSATENSFEHFKRRIQDPEYTAALHELLRRWKNQSLKPPRTLKTRRTRWTHVANNITITKGYLRRLRQNSIRKYNRQLQEVLSQL